MYHKPLTMNKVSMITKYSVRDFIYNVSRREPGGSVVRKAKNYDSLFSSLSCVFLSVKFHSGWVLQSSVNFYDEKSAIIKWIWILCECVNVIWFELIKKKTKLEDLNIFS